MQKSIPHHLKKYVVDQSQQEYTSEDQAVWRYTMTQLKSFLSIHAHECYLRGLEKVGIDVENIPCIEVINERLQEFGWGAIPVSGFIPPSAFMEFQSLGYLPIASDMRSVEHLLYTPAPDIVHEAAGHAPTLIDSSFSNYLREYAQVAKKAIISSEDMDVYRAIRELSDIKEHTNSTPKEIKEAEFCLEKVSHQVSYVSEAALLGRMNWWTAEYGLVGPLHAPKIFGAGLLSSIGEAQNCLSDKVKKIPLSLDCISYSYNITEPQPQLFVTPDFNYLSKILHELAETMAFKKAGAYGLKVAQKSKTVNTVELETGLQLSGVLSEVICSSKGDPIFIKFMGPTQICFEHCQWEGHDKEYHQHGYSTPLGTVEGRELHTLTEADLNKHHLICGQGTHLKFDSGITLKGTVSQLEFKKGKLVLVSFSHCDITYKDRCLFEASWGAFDLAVGTQVTSVFGGAADSKAYGLLDDFVAARVPSKEVMPNKVALHQFYQKIRDCRHAFGVASVEGLAFEKKHFDSESSMARKIYGSFTTLYEEYFEKFSIHWLPGFEILEIFYQFDPQCSRAESLKKHLLELARQNDHISLCISRGLDNLTMQ